MKGSKTKIADKIIELFPSLNSRCFVDLFCGSLAISLVVRDRYKKIPIIVNDIRMELYNLYMVMQDFAKKKQNDRNT